MAVSIYIRGCGDPTSAKRTPPPGRPAGVFFYVYVVAGRYRVTMTNVDVPEVRGVSNWRHGIGWILYAVGWSLARLLRAVVVAAGAVPYAVGWWRAGGCGRLSASATTTGGSRSAGVTDAPVDDRR